MSPPQLNPKILELGRVFWEWFLVNESDLRRDSIPDLVISEFEDHLFRVCKVDWEIGPDQSGLTYFSLSPVDGSDSYDAVTALLKIAPHHPQWRFTLFKPPRAWDLIFTLQIEDGDVEIDAKLWEFVVYAFKDETFDILFKVDDLHSRLDEDKLIEAAVIVLNGELGEAVRRDLVGDIEIVQQWKAEEQAKVALLEPGLLKQVLERRRMN